MKLGTKPTQFNLKYRSALWAGLATAILWSTTAVAPSSQAVAQVWQTSRFNSNVAAKGGLGVFKETAFLSAGDQISGTATVTLVAPFDVSVRFSGFGNPTNGAVSPFSMSLHCEATGLGVVYDGPAAGINNLTVTLPTSTTPTGVGLLLARTLIVTKDVSMGTYSDKGQIVISQI